MSRCVNVCWLAAWTVVVALLGLPVAARAEASIDDCDDFTPVAAATPPSVPSSAGASSAGASSAGASSAGASSAGASSTQKPATAAPAPVEVVVPCAVVDDGALGADCPEVWIVNHQGTPLCRVDLLAFAATSSGPVVEPIDGDASGGAAFVAVGVVPTLLALPPLPLVRDVDDALDAAAGGPADAHGVVPPRPS
jgi:hypothetical protein